MAGKGRTLCVERVNLTGVVQVRNLLIRIWVLCKCTVNLR